jgi:hypothetical protein
MKKYTGYEAQGELTYCLAKPDKESNDLEESCPFFDFERNKDWHGNELIVLIHNQGMYN